MHEILLIDDDVELCSLVAEYLGREGWLVRSTHDADSGLAAASAARVSLVILDVMLPNASGLEVLRTLRRSSMVPVLMLTARGEEIDRIVGLELGADDYMAKPFHPRELAARIRAILRRGSEASGDGKVPSIRVGDVALDPGARMARRGERPLPLTSVEFDLLRALLENAGHVVSREMLSRRALGREHEAMDRSVDMHVSNLRRKLDGDTATPEESSIRTLRNAGYLFVRSASPRADDDA